jgi:hypothetical protein
VLSRSGVKQVLCCVQDDKGCKSRSFAALRMTMVWGPGDGREREVAEAIYNKGLRGM